MPKYGLNKLGVNFLAFNVLNFDFVKIKNLSSKQEAGENSFSECVEMLRRMTGDKAVKDDVEWLYHLAGPVVKISHTAKVLYTRIIHAANGRTYQWDWRNWGSSPWRWSTFPISRARGWSSRTPSSAAPESVRCPRWRARWRDTAGVSENAGPETPSHWTRSKHKMHFYRVKYRVDRSIDWLIEPRWTNRTTNQTIYCRTTSDNAHSICMETTVVRFSVFDWMYLKCIESLFNCKPFSERNTKWLEHFSLKK